MGPCGDQGAAHRSVGAEDAGRHSIDGQLPSWVVHVGKHDQSRRFETGGQFNTLRLVAIDGDRFGRLGSRSRKRPGDARPVAGIDFQPGQGFGIVDLAGSTRKPGPHQLRGTGSRCYPEELRQTSGSNQYWSAEIVSPPLRVMRPRRATTLIVSLMNLTLPSPNRQLTPPGW
jgi:hypothetical protein